MAYMSSLILVSLLLVLVTVESGTTMNDEVTWRVSDIKAWDDYFYTRGLKEEERTLSKISKLIVKMPLIMWTSLDKALEFPKKELQIAKMMMEGTSAQGCIDGISHYLNRTIDTVMIEVNNSIADLSSDLRRCYRDWARQNDSHSALVQNTLAGIASCVKTYPNKESRSRLMSCVDMYSQRYFSSVSGAYNVKNSPGMTSFVNTVVVAAVTAGTNITEKGREFLRMLSSCAKLSDNVDAQEYEQRVMNEFDSYLPDTEIDRQISDSQFQYSLTVSEIEREMLAKYYARKAAYQTYVIEPSTLDIYKAQLGYILQSYRDVISSTSKDNPTDLECITAANNTLNGVISAAAQSALRCDIDIINDTNYHFSCINDSFIDINDKMTNYGNVAALSCFEEGYIYQKDTILKSFKISSLEFDVFRTQAMTNIYNSVHVLENYKATFFEDNSFPCGDKILKEVNWHSESTLFGLERCLYKNSGGNYEVTTSSSAMTETTTSVQY